MKITKFGHSCLLVEENNISAIIDPGSYSKIPVKEINKLDYILITHNHFDHMFPPLVKELAAKFPNAKIIGPSTVKESLDQEKIAVDIDGDKNIEVTNAPHHIMFDMQTENYLFTVGGKLSHPGDSFEFAKTAVVLALPIVAPWGSTHDAVMLAVKLKPKTVIPIHDSFFKEESRKQWYQWIKGFLQNHGIALIEIEDGEPVEI